MAKIKCKYCNKDFADMLDQMRHYCPYYWKKKIWKHKIHGGKKEVIEWRRMP